MSKKGLLTAILPIIFSVIALILFCPDINSIKYYINTGDMTWIGFVFSLCVFTIPAIGFIVIACLSILGKIKVLVTLVLTLIWLIACLPLTWFIALAIDQYLFLGLELYL